MDGPDPSRQYVRMFSVAQDKWLPFTATLDTGTPANWISEASLQRLALLHRYEASVDFINFNGKTIKSNEVVEIRWCPEEGNRKTRLTKFRVAKTAPFDVVLGTE